MRGGAGAQPVLLPTTPHQATAPVKSLSIESRRMLVSKYSKLAGCGHAKLKILYPGWYFVFQTILSFKQSTPWVIFCSGLYKWNLY